MSGTVLLVDDDPQVLTALGRFLTGLDYQVEEAATGAGALERFTEHRPDAVILDLGLPDVDGLEVLGRLREYGAVVVMLTGQGDIETAVRAMQLGAENFLTKPVEPQHLGAVVARAVEKARLKRENRLLRASVADEDPNQLSVLGASPEMQDIARKIRLLAESDRTTVLLTGESGTGKGWVARILHRLSPRRNRPFVEVNCAGLTSTFLASELFGHERGAYTDAKDSREGLFQAADQGVLFLDEMGDLAPDLQPKLLHVLENRSFRRLGGSREITVDVRLVAATNRDLQAAVDRGDFREDLFYRLNVTPIHLPPLRARSVEDRMALVHRLNAEVRRDMRRGPGEVSDEAVEALVAYAWPGNIREMRNVLERAIIFGGTGDVIRPEHLPAELRSSPRGRASGGFKPESLQAVERRHIERVLRHHDGNRSRAAKDLGIARATLINKIRIYGIDA